MFEPTLFFPPHYPHSIHTPEDELPSLFDGDLFVSIEDCDALDTISAEDIGQRLADIMVCGQPPIVPAPIPSHLRRFINTSEA